MGADYDAAYDRALDAGLCREAAADYAYDAWRGFAPAPHPEPIYDLDSYGELEIVGRHGGVSDDYLERQYDLRCRGGG